MPGGHTGLKLSHRLQLLLGHHGTLIFENFNQALQHICQTLTRAQSKGWRDKCRVEREMPRSTPHDPGQWQSKKVLTGFRFERQPNILVTQLNRLLVAASIFVVQHLDNAAVTGTGIGTGLQFAVLPTGKPSRYRQTNGQMVGGGREDRGNIASLRHKVTPGNVERQTIVEHPTGVHQRHGSVAERIRIELAGGESITVPPQARSREMNGIPETPVLRLEMMRGQIHPFRPHDFGKQLHAESPARSRSLSPEPATLENKYLAAEPSSKPGQRC